VQFLDYKVSAIIIQARVRALLGRLRLADMIVAVTMLQSAYRMWRVRRVFLSKRRCAILMQALRRSCAARSRYRMGRLASIALQVCVQTACMSFVSRRPQRAKLLLPLVHVSTRAYSHSLPSSACPLRRLITVWLHSGCLLIPQSLYRMRRDRRQFAIDIARFRKNTIAARVIQRRVRRWLARLRLSKLRRCVPLLSTRGLLAFC
jgi:hypothetical protein